MNAGTVVALTPFAGFIESALSMVLGRDGLAGVLLALLLRVFGLRIYETHRTPIIRSVLDVHKPMSTRLYNYGATGIVWGREFIGVCDRTKDIPILTLVTTQRFFDSVASGQPHIGMVCAPPGPETRPEAAPPLRIAPGAISHALHGDGGFTYMNMMCEFAPTPAQERIIVDARACLHRHGRCAVFVDGAPGTGKSSIASLLTLSLGDAICVSVSHAFKKDHRDGPVGEIRMALHNCTGFDAKYCVLLLDDMGVQIEDAILKESVTDDLHRGACRASWNLLLDHFHQGAYRNAIIVITSNTPWAEISARDSALLRPGRVDVRATLVEPVGAAATDAAAADEFD